MGSDCSAGQAAGQLAARCAVAHLAADAAGRCLWDAAEQAGGAPLVAVVPAARVPRLQACWPIARSPEVAARLADFRQQSVVPATPSQLPRCTPLSSPLEAA